MKTPKADDSVIEDVNLVFNEKLKKDYLGYIIAFIAGYPIWIILTFPYFTSGSVIVSLTFQGLLIVPPVLFAFFLNLQKEKILTKFYEQFAKANGYTFSAGSGSWSGEGALFQIGETRSRKNVINGNFKNHAISFFNYQYTIRQGKSTVTYNYTVFEIDYDRRIPKMFLRVDKDRWQMVKPKFANIRKLPLEGNFDDYFDLFVEEKFEIEALQIFTPDIMDKLITDWHQFTLEFTYDKIYIYSFYTISKKKDLQAMYGLAQYLIEKLAPVLRDMEPSFVAMHEKFNLSSK